MVRRRRLGRVILKVTGVADGFLGGQDHGGLDGGLLSADSAVHRGSKLNGC